MEIGLQTLPEIPNGTPDSFQTRMRNRLASLDRVIYDPDPDPDPDADPDADPERRTGALLIVKGFFERIDIVPLPGRGRIKIDIEPRTDALVGLALQEDWKFEPGGPGTPS